MDHIEWWERRERKVSDGDDDAPLIAENPLSPEVSFRISSLVALDKVSDCLITGGGLHPNLKHLDFYGYKTKTENRDILVAFDAKVGV